MNTKEMNEAAQVLATQIADFIDGQNETIAIGALSFLAALFVASSPNREQLSDVYYKAATQGIAAGEGVTDRPVLH